MIRCTRVPSRSVSLNPRSHYASRSMTAAPRASAMRPASSAPARGVSTTKIRPLADRVLVQKVKAEEKTAGGIVLPESAQESRVPRGKVLAVGFGHRQKDGTMTPLSVKVGDQVVLNEFGGTDVKLDGETYTLYREDDILGILEEEGAQAAKSTSAGKKTKA